MADQTRKTARPATRRATPAIRASAARAECRPCAADARRRRGSSIKISGASLAKARALRKMCRMRATPAVRRRQVGPFLIPARTLMLASGLLAVGLGTFTLLHERHSGQVDVVYMVVALIVGAVWVVCLILAFLGFRIGIFVAAAIAFADFGVTSSSHFESGPGAMGGFVRSEGLPVATVAMGLVCACVLTVIS